MRNENSQALKTYDDLKEHLVTRHKKATTLRRFEGGEGALKAHREYEASKALLQSIKKMEDLCEEMRKQNA